MSTSVRSKGFATAFWSMAIGIALMAGVGAASQVFPSASISRLGVFSARDGDSLARRFDQMLLKQGSDLPDGSRWQSQAKRVLMRNPLEADVVRVAALSTTGPNVDIVTIRSQMLLSERIAGRDLPTQLWLLEDAVSRGDVGEVLQHYDRALSVYPRTQGQLYPVLTSAISDRDIRSALAPYIRGNRPWSYDYIGYAVDKAAEPADIADLMALAGGSRSVPKNRPLETMMLNKLVATGRFDTALRYMQTMAPPAVTRAVMGDFRFSAATMMPDLRPFTWSMTEDLSIQVVFNAAEGLIATASGGIGGVAADRVMMLKPGKWRLVQTVELPRLSPMMEAAWSAACLTSEGARPIWNQPVPQQPGEQQYQSTIDIPSGCRATRFRLTVRGADVQEDSTITLRRVDLVRA